jgi:hypothetical protein
VNELDRFEDDLIERFRSHPVLRNLDRLTDANFRTVLLQRRFLSLAFTTAYDLAIDLLTDEQGLKIARVILREEYPGSKGDTPSHREDMKEDLLALGVSRAELVETAPTPVTLKTITDTLGLISDAGRGEHTDARLLTILRFWGEVLVSVEYGALWPRMAPRLTVDGRNRSRFYYPHHVHDAKVRPLEAPSALSATHSDQLGRRLWKLLGPQQAKDSFRRTEKAIVELKTGFYDQFEPMLRASAVSSAR